MNTSLLDLDKRLSSSYSLKPKNELGELVNFQLFPKLENILSKISIGQIKKEKEPKSEIVIKAIQQLLNSPESLSKNDWRLIFWGLNFKINGECLIDSDQFVESVMKKIDDLTKLKEITKREWFALCAGYFDYAKPSEDNIKWISLRKALVKSFAVLEKNQTKSRPWIEIVKNNIYLLSNVADKEFAKLIVHNDAVSISNINQTFPISDASWIWKKTFSSLDSTFEKIDDQKYLSYLPDLMHLILKYPVHRNVILSALLTRYHKSKYRLTTHNVLKHAALDIWGSPQLKTSKNTWLVNVSSDVVNMVLRWFAKDDLEHFFKLLKTEEGVDQRRLNFWIDYVDQITFTKIVLGRDALTNNSSDFRDFRSENKGRLSELLSATANNNAFIMQLKNYWFVEFSETGNACYVYHEDSLPFNSGERRLDLKYELKISSNSKEKIFHSGDWETKAEYILRKLNIYK